MKSSTRRVVSASLVLVGIASAALAQGTGAAPAATAPKAPATLHSAVAPVSRGDDAGWLQRHEAIVAKAKAGADLVFIGDSITQGWEGEGKEAWGAHYGERNALNAGIGGDRTQHVLWRLDHGVLDALAAAERKPKLAIVMIGTNNSNGEDNTAAEIADGIVAIVKRVRAKLPETRVLLLAIFPRSEKPDAQREKNAQASKLVFASSWDKNVRTLDIGAKFLGPDGTLSKEVMPDFLHLSPKAYETWAAAIEPVVAEFVPVTKR